MFKWFALAVAALGIASMTFCFWPRAYLAKRVPRVEIKHQPTPGTKTLTRAIIDGDMTLDEAIERYGKKP